MTDPDELWETTISPATRRLVQVRVEQMRWPPDEIFTTLMGDRINCFGSSSKRMRSCGGQPRRLGSRDVPQRTLRNSFPISSARCGCGSSPRTGAFTHFCGNENKDQKRLCCFSNGTIGFTSDRRDQRAAGSTRSALGRLLRVGLDPDLGFGIDVAGVASRCADRRTDAAAGWCPAF